jgi:putative hydrolase of the HAD superfamily
VPSRVVDPALARDIDLLCLDAGNTIVFLDHARLAALCSHAGFAVSANALIGAEGRMKLAIERGEGVDVEWSNAHVLAARGWALTVGTMLECAGLGRDRVAGLLDAIWPDHVRRNLWSLVPAGLVDSLVRVRQHDVCVAVVSNSEGMLERLFDDLGVVGAFDLVVDSGIAGIEKPDPRIFRVALDRFDVEPSRALHLGDTYATDIVGARAAGLRVALIDPYDHLAGRHADVPRVPGVREVADAIAALCLRPRR